MTLRPAQAALAAVLREHAIREGEFTLDVRTHVELVSRRPAGRASAVTACEIVGDAIVDALAEVGITAADFDAVGGPVVGAVPVALAVALVTGKPSFAIRKEAKDHGVGGRIAGRARARRARARRGGHRDERAALLEALPVVEEIGCPIVAVSLLLDRGGRLGAQLDAHGITLRARCSARPTSGYEFGS